MNPKDVTKNMDYDQKRILLEVLSHPERIGEALETLARMIVVEDHVRVQRQKIAEYEGYLSDCIASGQIPMTAKEFFGR